MALPKNQSAIYPLQIPSTGRDVNFRPFVVKDEKALMLAMQSENETTMVNTLRDLIKNCVEEDLDVNSLATFDLEYAFAQMRGKSVGEVVELVGKCDNEEAGCVDNPKAQVKLAVDITTIPVVFPEGHDKKISLWGDVGVVMKYPTIETIMKYQGLTEDADPDKVFEIVMDSMETIYEGDQLHYIKDQTLEEVNEFINNLTSEQFLKVRTFFETMPKMTKTIEYTCPNCGRQHKKTMEGLQSFFG
jgi:hypothetical protein|tara:strand:- start:8292 stop:9026 length:735 start_codon:yes stop_codon:yes gene_type:complete